MKWLALFLLVPMLHAADLAGSKDPPGMKRYEGSVIIGYRAPKFDEYLLPLGVPTSQSPPAYKKSLNVEGQVSRYTYVATPDRTATEVMRNYKLEFQRLGLETMYEKVAGSPGWFGPTFSKISDDDGISQVLPYNEAEERMLVGKTKDAQPTYFMVFVTIYKDGYLNDRVAAAVKKGSPMVEVVVVQPDVLEKKMTFVNADEMKGAIGTAGKVVLYGIFFDTDKDVVKPESKPTLDEIVKLLSANPQLRVHVVGHTDNQGKLDYNVDLSKRRAANVVRELTTKFGVAADRLDAFGAGQYAPIASNMTEDGRAKNRRVELVQ